MIKVFTVKQKHVHACKIEDGGSVTVVEGKDNTYLYQFKGKGSPIRQKLEFTSKRKPEAGDYIHWDKRHGNWLEKKEAFDAKYVSGTTYLY